MAEDLSVTVTPTDVVVIKDVVVIASAETARQVERQLSSGLEGETKITIIIRN